MPGKQLVNRTRDKYIPEGWRAGKTPGKAPGKAKEKARHILPGLKDPEGINASQPMH